LEKRLACLRKTSFRYQPGSLPGIYGVKLFSFFRIAETIPFFRATAAAEAYLLFLEYPGQFSGNLVLVDFGSGDRAGVVDYSSSFPMVTGQDCLSANRQLTTGNQKIKVSDGLNLIPVISIIYGIFYRKVPANFRFGL